MAAHDHLTRRGCDSDTVSAHLPLQTPVLVDDKRTRRTPAKHVSAHLNTFSLERNHPHGLPNHALTTLPPPPLPLLCSPPPHNPHPPNNSFPHLLRSLLFLSLHSPLPRPTRPPRKPPNHYTMEPQQKQQNNLPTNPPLQRPFPHRPLRALRRYRRGNMSECRYRSGEFESRE
jgi:hypothetical protein